MRSAAEPRAALEWVLRAGAMTALVVALVRLVLAAQAGEAPRLHLRAEGGLAPRLRDSVVARSRAGERVTWSGAVAALAATSEPVRDPSGRTRILVAGDGGASLGDSLGTIETLETGAGTLATSGVAGAVRVRAVAGDGGSPTSDSTEARTPARTAGSPGRVLVLGRVGWEAKFTIAALEEAGWTVDAQLALGDTMRITQGRAGDPSLATHAVVVVLDSMVGARAAAISRFVRAGGGLVLSGDGAAASAFSAIAPARAGAERAGVRDAWDRGEPRLALPFRPLTAARADAVIIEPRDAAAIILARRVGAGRVVQSGLDETWRWRMEAGENGPAEHRAFWSNLVATAAAAPLASAGGAATTRGAPDTPDLDESPRATLIDRLGPPVADAPASTPLPPETPTWLGLIALALLVGEWASRRARGAA